MAKYSNAKILAAVINKWSAPIVNSIVANNIGIFPFVTNIEQKLRSSGWVSPSWSASQEFAPLVSNVTSIVVEPMLASYLSGIPDESIPKVAHAVVDNAIKQGGLSLLEGHISFDIDDLTELKRYLDYNLPLGKNDDYEVIVKQ